MKIALSAKEGMETPQGPVLAKCDSDTGHWHCVTCAVGFSHNMEMGSHVEHIKGDHTVAWICHLHGPEVP